jgi:23S rRNA U2552 (ribose-2'-O)-methylase RlmE/FtsJ
METITKPPWQTVTFQAAIFADEELCKRLQQVKYDVSWNEIPHQELNEMKQKIEPLESNHQWETLKKKTNPYELVYTQDSSNCPPSVAVLKPLSRSYFKMIEILQVAQFFDRLPKTTSKLRSAHVAEGPGGFIEAFLDRASMARLPVSKSYAMTLKPTNNHVPGWRRSYQFLQRHPEVKIHYGEDGTGDLYVPANQKSFIHLHEPPKANVFTGDGGFDFSVDYENQEKTVYTLLVASAIVGLQVLSADGLFVLKLFDVFSSPTHYLLRLITLCFKEWYLYKPATSRPCNSERYLICRGFRKAYPAVLEALHTLQSKCKDMSVFPQTDFFAFFSPAEQTYLEQHIQQFSRNQSHHLQATLEFQTHPASEFSWKQQYEHAHKWCTEFHVPYTMPKQATS